MENREMWAAAVIFIIAVFFGAIGFDLYKRWNSCEGAGGVMTRSGCLDPAVFVPTEP